jgi:hypothetical protein
VIGKSKKIDLKITMALIFAMSLTSAFAEDQKLNKSGYKKDPQGFSAPGSTTEQLQEDDEIKNPALVFESFDNLLQPWFGWKTRLNENTGLQLGVAYTSLFQSASNAPAGIDKNAESGILRISGRWALHNAESGNTGTLVFSMDHRHT